MICSLIRDVSRASVKLQKKIIIYKSHDECRVCQKTKFCWKWNSSFHFRFDQFCLVWQRRLLHHHVNKLFVTWIDLMSHKKKWLLLTVHDIINEANWTHIWRLSCALSKVKENKCCNRNQNRMKLATERDRTSSTIGADNEADRH